MEPNKPADVPEEMKETYTPGQQAILKLLQWGAWTAVFVAILNVMHA